MEAEARRRDIVQAAIESLAHSGVEGLRVRAVANEVGINHATLLHYFPTKAALIKGAALEIARRFAAPMPDRGRTLTPVEELRWEFDDALRRVVQESQELRALVDLMLRASGDPALAALLDGIFGGWRRQLGALVRRGAAAGDFRSDVDPGAAADAIIGLIQGIALEAISGMPKERVGAAMETAELAAERLLTRN